MKVAQLIVAVTMAVSAASSFAQSTQAPLNEDVQAQIAQQQPAYRYDDSSDQTKAAVNEWNRASVPGGQVTVDMGRYSLSVARPSF